MDMKLLETHDLVKSFSGRTVVDKVSLVVHDREIVGLLGRNGAGKTTSFRMTIGMITPDAGQVNFEGRDITKMPMYQRARLGIGYLSQEPSVFQRLTVAQNLLAILETMSLTRKDRHRRCDELIDQFGLQKVRKQQARILSGGERRKLEIARALVTNPSLILLDEPFSGVDPIAVEDLQREIRRLLYPNVLRKFPQHRTPLFFPIFFLFPLVVCRRDGIQFSFLQTPLVAIIVLICVSPVPQENLESRRMHAARSAIA